MGGRSGLGGRLRPRVRSLLCPFLRAPPTLRFRAHHPPSGEPAPAPTAVDLHCVHKERGLPAIRHLAEMRELHLLQVRDLPWAAHNTARPTSPEGTPPPSY